MRSCIGIAVIASLLLAGAASAQTTVQTELMMLCDISGSIDEVEFELQRAGYANAFRNSIVQDLIGEAPGGVAATMIWWSGPDEQEPAVGWSHLTDAASCEAFANVIEASVRPFKDGVTAPGSAINFGAPQFWTNDFLSSYQVLDVSGDGIENAGDSTAVARDAALLAGIERINGLAIQSHAVEQWYIENIQGGEQSFTYFAEDFDDFADAVSLKIKREITPIPEPSTCALLGLGILGAAGMYMRRRRS